MPAGQIVLVGWAFDIRILRQPFPTIASMKANAALAFVLASLSLRILSAERSKGISALLGASVALLGLLTLSQDVFGWDLRIDERLVTDSLAVATSAPGRMSPLAAFCFVALGLALIASTRRAYAWLAQPPAVLSALVGALALMGYLYDVPALYGIGSFTTIAVHTAALLVVLSVGVLFLHRDTGLMAPIMSDHIEGQFARRLLPAGIAIPVVIGWFRLQGQRAGLYGTEFGLSITVVGSIVVLSIVTWVNARSLGRADAHRRGADDELRWMNETLERQVADRTAELRSSVAERERFFALSVDVLAIAGADGYFKRVSPSIEEALGHTAEEFIANPFMDYVHPDDAASTLAEVESLAAGKSTLAFENRYRCKDGSYRWLSWRAVPDAQTGLMYCAARDITAAKASREQLRSSLAEKEVLLREVHHRVKNNLAVISSLLYLESAYVVDPKAAAVLEDSQRRVRSMALVHETLHGSDTLGAVDFGSYAGRLARELVSALAVGKAVTLTTKFDPFRMSIDLAVPCGLILNELISNAFKHAFPEGTAGEIVVTMNLDSPGMVRLQVSDNGIGIPADLDVETHNSLGLRLIRALSRQVRGAFELRATHPGTQARLIVPLEEVDAQHP